MSQATLNGTLTNEWAGIRLLFTARSVMELTQP